MGAKRGVSPSNAPSCRGRGQVSYWAALRSGRVGGRHSALRKGTLAYSLLALSRERAARPRSPTCLALLQKRGSQCIWDLVHSGAAPAPHGLFVQCARPHSRKLTVGTKQGTAFASGVLRPWPSALWPLRPSSRLSPKPSWGTSGNSHAPGQTHQRGDTWLQNGGGRKLCLGTVTCLIHSLVAKYRGVSD